jgi:hypothetical protein
VTSRALDAARDALITLQGQLIALLAARNAALEERVGELEERLARLERAASRNCLFTEQRSVFPQFSRRAATSVNTVPGHEQRGCS